MTCYHWKSGYGDMDRSDVKWVEKLEAANARLTAIYADLALKSTLLQGLTEKETF